MTQFEGKGGRKAPQMAYWDYCHRNNPFISFSISDLHKGRQAGKAALERKIRATATIKKGRFRLDSTRLDVALSCYQPVNQARYTPLWAEHPLAGNSLHEEERRRPSALTGLLSRRTAVRLSVCSVTVAPVRRVCVSGRIVPKLWLHPNSPAWAQTGPEYRTNGFEHGEQQMGSKKHKHTTIIESNL